MMNPICGFCGEHEDIYGLPNQNYGGVFTHYCSAVGHEVMRRATSKRDFDALENGRCMSQANAKAER